MKLLASSIAIIFASLSVAIAGAGETLPIDKPGNKRTITFAAEGEDASSGFYYFFYSLPNEDISKVRVLWNGGSGNKPTITDYYFCDTYIWIFERTAEPRDLPALAKGRDVGFQSVAERFIKTAPPENDHLYKFPETGEMQRLSQPERDELTNLISILTKSRKPLPKK